MAAKRVLLTGANGYIAQHVLSAFLEAGHSVRGIVRTQSKVDQVAKTFAKYTSTGTGQLDFGIVPDITVPGAFDAVLKSTPPFDTVVHTASPFNYRVNSSAAEFLGPAVRGTTEVLEGIVRAVPSVRRVVLTSSMAAVLDLDAPKFTTPAKVYTEADWSPITEEAANQPGAPVPILYVASKKYAEKAAWDFVASRKPAFDLVVLNPPMVYGPLFDPSIVAKSGDLGESTFLMWDRLIRPGLTATDPMAPTGLHLYVDVRDIARANLLGATVPAAGGHRFVICGGEMTMQKAANLMRAALPEFQGRIPKGDPDQESVGKGAFTASSKLAEDILGLTFTPAEQTIGDLARQLAEIDARGLEA